MATCSHGWGSDGVGPHGCPQCAQQPAPVAMLDETIRPLALSPDGLSEVEEQRLLEISARLGGEESPMTDEEIARCVLCRHLLEPPAPSVVARLVATIGSVRNGNRLLYQQIASLHARCGELKEENRKLQRALDASLLPGWTCPRCGVFTGDAKERHERCRSCDAPRPAAGP